MGKSNIIQVNIPSVRKEETQYIFKCLFEEFLGINYSISITEDIDFVIIFNSQKITISNLFFNKEDGVNIYTSDNIPNYVNEGSIQVNNTEFPIVSLFGPLMLKKQIDGYYLKSDIIASTFFMLTRWEEKVNPNRDNHERFPAKYSIAVKFGFLERPIVNEYLELLWGLLKEIGFKGTRKNREYKIIPTHDVDFPLLWVNTFSKIRYFLAKTLQGRFREINRAIKHIKKGQDPFDTYDKLMDFSDSLNVKSYFFFLSGIDNKFHQKFDLSDPFVKSIIGNIKSRGHKVGFHPSYFSIEKTELFAQEKFELEEVTGSKISCGRQHFLRFEVPKTWNVWNENGMHWESSMSYPSQSGFRCGICYPFQVFDFERRQQLKLIERPLIAMDATFILKKYENLSIQESKEKVKSLKDTVRKYNGDFVFLWHNSTFHVEEYYEYESLLEVMYE